MVASWMCELALTGAADSEAFNRNQLLCREELTHDGVRQVERVSLSRRMLRVLVVDDEQDSADTLTWLVRCWGHSARSAYDGGIAVQMAVDQNPDVVLLDIAMPLTDGCQVARQLRLDLHKDCLIIAITGHADEQCRRQCNEAGIDLVLIKPVDPSVVETLLMLEYVRVNRSQSDNTAGLAATGTSQLVGKKPSPEERDLPLSRRALA